MARIKLEHAYPVIDRYGKIRWYYRRRGQKNVRLPGVPGGENFMAAYAMALSAAEPIEIGAKRTKAGTVAATVGTYLGSTAFANLEPSTRRIRRNILERFREEHGDKPVALIARKHVQVMVDAKAATPSAARNFLHVLRALMVFAIKEGIRDDDPTQGVTRPKIETEGFETWGEDNITVFKATHASGTVARLALELLLSTGQRVSDIVRMGRQHIRGDMIEVRQQKTDVRLWIKIAPDLKREIDAAPPDHLIFMMTAQGKPRTAGGFTGWFREKCAEAGIRKGLSAHGLRKAVCCRLADAGCTAHEIMAISGHRSLREVERYTRAVEQKRLALAAAARLTSAGHGGKA